MINLLYLLSGLSSVWVIIETGGMVGLIVGIGVVGMALIAFKVGGFK